MKYLLANIIISLFFLNIKTFAQQNCCNGLPSLKKNKRGEGIIGINTNFPTVGSSKLAVILVGFNDMPFTLTNEDFNQLFNQKGYNNDGFIGSVSDYFHDISNGKMDLTIDVAGPYTLSRNRSFYGEHANGNLDANPQTMASEAIGLADKDLNFSNYDNDGDGNADGLYIIFAGNGEEAGGGDNAIWSHKSQLNNQIQKDGVYLKMYSCSPEFRLRTSKITGIGVICHEFLHACGLPDLYDTDYDASGGTSKGLGDWGIMASGAHTNEGKTPPQISAFEKYLLKWLDPIELTEAKSIILPPLSSHNIAYKMNTDTENEYFIIENRQPLKWDKYLPSHGMLIYHIDKNISDWSNNKINVTPGKEGYNLLFADNILTEGSYDGDPFPGSMQKIKINNTSTPSLRKNDGGTTPHELNNIVEDEVSGILYFDYLGGDAVSADNFTARLSEGNTISLSWNSKSNQVLLAGGEDPFCPLPDVSVTPGTSLGNNMQVLYKGSNNEFVFDNAKAGTSYYFNLWIKNNNRYTGQKTCLITTYKEQLKIETLPYREDFETDVFKEEWNVFNEGGTTHQLWKKGSFSRGLYIPDNSNYAYLNSELYGEAGIQNASLASPVFDFSNKGKIFAGFDHYYRKIDSSLAIFQYSIDGGFQWSDINVWQSGTSNGDYFVTDISNEVAGQSNVRFRWLYKGSYGYFWCIDNVLITEHDIVSTKVPKDKTIRLYPNPAKIFFTIEGKGDFMLTITDIYGRTVMLKKNINKKEIIYIGNFKKGIYFVTIKGEHFIVNETIIKN